jgi:hypothetical protein
MSSKVPDKPPGPWIGRPPPPPPPARGSVRKGLQSRLPEHKVTRVYVVHMWRDVQQEMVGVFDDESKAVAACKDWRYGIGPLTLNEITPEEPTEWPGFYYPIKSGDRT